MTPPLPRLKLPTAALLRGPELHVDDNPSQ